LYKRIRFFSEPASPTGIRSIAVVFLSFFSEEYLIPRINIVAAKFFIVQSGGRAFNHAERSMFQDLLLRLLRMLPCLQMFSEDKDLSRPKRGEQIEKTGLILAENSL
jgi:hypothetical protein